MSYTLSSRRILRTLSSALKDYQPARPASRRISFARRDQQLLNSRPACAPELVKLLCRSNRIARSASTTTTTTTAPETPNSQSSSALPDLSSHYSIFPRTLPLGPPPAGPFNIDLPSLRREFLQLQGRFHPDKFPQEQKSKAEALSSRINEAYKALRHPLLRAQYLLLHSHAIDVTSEDNSSHPTEPGILLEVMEVQESIEEAETEDQITVLKEQNRERIEETVRLLDEAFSSGNPEAARNACIRLQYWASLAEGLNAWDGKGNDVRLVH
jgi:molecular chaperone HscB